MNARRLGAVLQGIILGTGLSLALVYWLLLVEGTSAFRYQGF